MSIVEATGAIKYAFIDHAASGDNEIVAAVAGKKIRVLAWHVTVSGTTTIRFESSAGGTALTGQMAGTANAELTEPWNPCGWFETVAGESLNMELSAAVSVDGALVYQLIA